MQNNDNHWQIKVTGVCAMCILQQHGNRQAGAKECHALLVLPELQSAILPG